MKKSLTTIFTLLCIVVFCQTPCIMNNFSVPLPVGETRVYGTANFAHCPTCYQWTVDPTSTASVSLANANQSHVSVTALSPGTFTLSVRVFTSPLSYFDCNGGTIPAIECNEQEILDFHGPRNNGIKYTIVGSNAEFEPMLGYDDSKYTYNWLVERNNGTLLTFVGGKISVPANCSPGDNGNGIVEVKLEVLDKRFQPYECYVSYKKEYKAPICANVVVPRVNVYPNPVLAELNISSNDLGLTLHNHSILIYDSQGNTVLNSKLSSKLNLSNLKSGIYSYKIMDEKGLIIQESKIVKK